LPGEQPAIMDRALFDAVQQKLRSSGALIQDTDASAHLLTGLLFDDSRSSSSRHRHGGLLGQHSDRTMERKGHVAGMVPTHATKAGRTLSLLCLASALHGESKQQLSDRFSRIPAADIEDKLLIAQRALNTQKKKPTLARARWRSQAMLEQVARIDAHEDRLIVR